MAHSALHQPNPTVLDAGPLAGTGDLQTTRLWLTLTALFGSAQSPPLPAWPYETWCGLLHYPELAVRPNAATMALARDRDRALAHPAVGELAGWAAQRCAREDPVPAIAAALTEAGQAAPNSTTDLEMVTDRICVAVDSARSAYRPPAPRMALVADPDRLGAPPHEPPSSADRTHEQNFRRAITSLLCLAGLDPTMPPPGLVEVGVDQARRWWLEHAIPPPDDLPGPRLPGVRPAGELPSRSRLCVEIPDPSLRALVAGRPPGRSRGCQAAWREGLTFWVAARLAAGLADSRPTRPPDCVVRHWRTQIDYLGCQEGRGEMQSVIQVDF